VTETNLEHVRKATLNTSFLTLSPKAKIQDRCATSKYYLNWLKNCQKCQFVYILDLYFALGSGTLITNLEHPNVQGSPWLHEGEFFFLMMLGRKVHKYIVPSLICFQICPFGSFEHWTIMVNSVECTICKGCVKRHVPPRTAVFFITVTLYQGGHRLSWSRYIFRRPATSRRLCLQKIPTTLIYLEVDYILYYMRFFRVQQFNFFKVPLLKAEYRFNPNMLRNFKVAHLSWSWLNYISVVTY